METKKIYGCKTCGHILVKPKSTKQLVDEFFEDEVREYADNLKAKSINAFD